MEIEDVFLIFLGDRKEGAFIRYEMKWESGICFNGSTLNMITN